MAALFKDLGDILSGNENHLGVGDVLGDIQSGEFAKRFILENQAGNVGMNARRRAMAGHPLEEVGARLRGLMPWLSEKQLVDRSKN